MFRNVSEGGTLVTTPILRVTTRTACFSVPKPQHFACSVFVMLTVREYRFRRYFNRSFFVMETVCLLLARNCFDIS